VVFEAVSDTLLHDNRAPDVTKLDQAIVKLRIAIDKAADNPLASHNAIVLPFVIDTLRRDLGDLIDARAAGSDLRTGWASSLRSSDIVADRRTRTEKLTRVTPHRIPSKYPCLCSRA